MPLVYFKANLSQKHSLLRAVFKHSLAYHRGAFRTLWLHLFFAPNLLIYNEKGLLFLEQSSAENDAFSLSAPDEIRTHIDGTGNHNSIR